MLMNSGEYIATIEKVFQEIRSAQYRATQQVNSELVFLYHSIGCMINTHKEWGNKFIDNLAADIRREFPGSKGHSVRNLKHMAKFAEAYPIENLCRRFLHKSPGPTIWLSWTR